MIICGNKKGFTLLEVMIALAILSISVLTLIDVQTTAANMTVEAEHMMIATMLAEDKLLSVRVETENDGFSTQEVEEEGNFDEEYPNEYPGYRFEYTLRKMDIGGAASGMSSLLTAAGKAEDEQGTGPDVVGGVQDQAQNGILGMFGPEFLSEEVGRFIRELRVRVYWQEGRYEDYVEVVTHLINPSGKVTEAEEEAEDQEQAAEIMNGQ